MSNRLYVGNLAFSTSQEALHSAFSEFGEVVEAKLMIERETGRSRGFAFIEMASGDAARSAIEQMNGALMDGRPLRVNEAEQRPERSRGGGGGGRRDAGRNRW
jgi:RNA recognition motif-containing protein